MGHGSAFIVAVLVIIALIPSVMAATTSITVVKYADNNYSQSVDTQSLNLTQLQTLSSVYSNGPVYMQGPTFDANDPWGDGGQNMIDYSGHNGSQVSEITDEVGGMSDGDELKVQSSDGFSLYFGYDNVYTPNASQGDMIVAWWDSEYGFVPDWGKGMRLFFYTPQNTYGADDSLNLTLRDMEVSFDPWYRHNYTDSSGSWPSAKGLSAKYVQYLKIYPPHRYDFNTTGDTVESAYDMDDQITGATDLAKITADDADSYTTDTEVDKEKAAHRFVFDLSEDAADIEKLAFTWDGTSSYSDGSADQGATTYIWDGTSYATLTGDITSDISDYVVSGDVTVLVEQNTASDGDEKSSLSTDYVKLVVTHHHSN